MSLLKAVVKRTDLPDHRYYVEETTVGMKITCCVREDRGSFTILREMMTIEKSKPHWMKYIAEFYKLAAVHYPVPRQLDANRHKEGS